MNKFLPKATDFQKSIVFGYVISDGYLYKDGRLQVEQGSEQKEFVYWLHNQLKSLAAGEVKCVKKTHSKTKLETYSYRFYTKKIFQDLVSQIYLVKEGKRTKIVPKNLEQFLNPTVLAVWFMGDGTRYLSAPKGAYINAISFSNQEQLKIQQAFLFVFKLTINIHKAGKSQDGKPQYNFFVVADSYDKFFEMVYPIVSQVPSMLYKLNPIEES